MSRGSSLCVECRSLIALPMSPFPRRSDVLFLETSSLTGQNASQPFLLLAQSILHLLDTATIDPDAAGTGISFGERQLRAVASSSRLSFPSIRRRRDSVSLGDLVGRESRCCGSG